MRKASIHITVDRLEQILVEISDEYDYDFKLSEIKKLAAAIASKGKGYALNNRVIVVTNDKLKREVTKVTKESRGSTAIFAKVLQMIRLKLKHRNVALIKAGTKEFLELKEPTKLANEFCREYDLDITEGYKEYIELHIKNMGNNYRISSFKFNHEKILNLYEATRIISTDRNPESTEEAHQYYNQIISERTGFCEGYRENPNQYKCFVEIAETCKSLQISIETWIDAQFDGFNWVQAIPEPSQMVGSKAKQRVQKYCFKMGIKAGKAAEGGKKLNISKLKKAGK